ncbi:MAG: beta-lactamase family protein [Actinobacteria bacterium]|nr:beta-lactamase family protein [Actinomycetota bacterium]
MSDRPSWAADLDRRLADAQRSWQAPSVVGAVIREGQLAWAGAVGAAEVGVREAAADVSYRIGSITKTFTAVLVLQLRDAGLLDLDDRLDQHLPGTRHGAMTLRRLLAHISGIQREPVGELWIDLVPPDREQLLAGFEQAEQVLPQRATHHYSNLAYAILGEVVARLTGGSWEQALQERLLDPLGMTRTTLDPIAPHAQGYLTEPYADAVRPEPHTSTGAAAPAMQLWSTADDLVRWAGFLAGPDPAVLSPETLDEMRQPVVVFDPHAFTLAWGGGLMLRRVGERVLHGHGGAMPGFLAGCWAYRSETERSGAVVLANTGRAADPERLAADLLTAVLDAEPRRPPAWAPGEVPTGRGWPAWRRTFFEPAGADAWRAVRGREQGETLRVHRDPAGTPVRLVFTGYAYTREPLTFGELTP